MALNRNNEDQKHETDKSNGYFTSTDSESSEDKIYIGGLELKLSFILRERPFGMPMYACILELEKKFDIKIDFSEYQCTSASQFFKSIPSLIKVVRFRCAPHKSELVEEFGELGADDIILLWQETLSKESWELIEYYEGSTASPNEYKYVHDQIKYRILIEAKKNRGKYVTIELFKKRYSDYRQKTRNSRFYTPSIEGKSTTELIALIKSVSHHYPIAYDDLTGSFALVGQLYVPWMIKFRNKSKTDERIQFLKDLACLGNDMLSQVADPLCLFKEMDSSFLDRITLPLEVNVQYSTTSYIGDDPVTHYISGVIHNQHYTDLHFRIKEVMSKYTRSGFFGESNVFPAEWVLIGAPVAVINSKNEWVRGKIYSIEKAGKNPKLTVIPVDGGDMFSNLRLPDLKLLPKQVMQEPLWEQKFVLEGIVNGFQKSDTEASIIARQYAVLDHVCQQLLCTKLVGNHRLLGAWRAVVYIDEHKSITLNDKLVEMGIAEPLSEDIHSHGKDILRKFDNFRLMSKHAEHESISESSQNVPPLLLSGRQSSSGIGSASDLTRALYERVNAREAKVIDNEDPIANWDYETTRKLLRCNPASKNLKKSSNAYIHAMLS